MLLEFRRRPMNEEREVQTAKEAGHQVKAGHRVKEVFPLAVPPAANSQDAELLLPPLSRLMLKVRMDRPRRCPTFQATTGATDRCLMAI